MSEEQLNSPSKIMDLVLGSDAYKKYQRLLALDINFFVFDRNYQDLKMAIDKFSQSEQIGLLLDHEQSNLILHHMTRFLHNYLAAAVTLIEHSRLLIRDWYKHTDFLEEYFEQIRVRFAHNELAQFIEDLRNYALHYSLPVTGLRVEVRNDPETKQQSERVFFFMETATLFQWSKWTKGKAYLRAAGKEIVIEQLVDDYYQQVFQLHSWIQHRLEEVHAADFAWLYRMEGRFQELLKPLRENRAK